MNLVAFPCGKELVAPFCEKIDAAGSAALILKKQEANLSDLLSSYGFREVYALPEDFYGKVSSGETRAMLADIRRRGFERAYFPFNDFLGNAALLLAVLAPEVAALNPTSIDRVEARLPHASIPLTAPGELARTLASKIQAKIVNKLRAYASRLQAMTSGERGGEKPTNGLLMNFPYDCEVLARYAYASRRARGRVLEIGCGLGFGAYLMAELNPEIRILAVDNDPRAIELAGEMWADNGRLKFEVARAEDLPCGTSTIDSVICFEVIEHLQQPELLLREIKRVLAEGGRLLGSTPNSSLYPYRVNKNLPGAPEELRQAGVWPWHLQEFDEASVSSLMERFGFANPSLKYPTFTTGLERYNLIRSSSFDVAVEHLANLKWSVDDFAVLDSYYPCFSGFSFIFSGVKGKAELGFEGR